MRVYHYGYSAYGAASQIEQLMRSERVLLIDTRLKPYSWRSEWQGNALKAKYGHLYRQAGPCLGNLNFKGGPIKIVDLEKGIKGLMMYLQEGHDLILLCQCSHLGCHRYAILDALKQAMPEVEIVSPENASSVDTIKCLSVRQPFADWLVHPQRFLDAGLPPKRIENRDWTTSFRGPVLIHASKTFEDEALDYWWAHLPEIERAVSLEEGYYVRGAIVGQAELVSIVTESDDPWFCGTYGWVLANARPFEKPIIYKGQLKLFHVPMSILEEVVHV